MGQPGHAFAEPDQRRLGRAVHRRQLLDVGDGQAGDLCRTGRREFRQNLPLDPVESQRMTGDVVAIGMAVAHEDVHDAQREGGIGADADRQIEIRCLGAARAARIDDDDLDAALLALFLGQRPEVHVGRGQIGAPGDDEIGVHDRFGIGAADRADRDVPRGLAAGVAHRAGLQARRAQRMEQPVHQAAIHQALMGGVGVAQQGERSALTNDRLPFGGDFVEGGVPGDGLEPAGPLGTRPLQGSF